MMDLFKKRKAELKTFTTWLKRDREDVVKEVPDHVFNHCPSCNQTIVTKQLINNYHVCPLCGFPFRINAKERINQLLDYKSFKEIDSKLKLIKPQFLGYQEKLKKATLVSSSKEAITCGLGSINNHKVVIGVMDSYFMMGSMGAVVGQKITNAVLLAKRKKLPLVLVCCSGGARMQEGIISLMQMAKTSAVIENFKNSGGLYISVLTDPTYGGVSASFAMLGDITIAEPHANIGFAGKRVIEDTIREKLPDDFQSANFLMEMGQIDLIVPRQDLKTMLTKLLKLHGGSKRGYFK